MGLRRSNHVQGRLFAAAVAIAVIAPVASGCGTLGLSASKPDYIEHNEDWIVIEQEFNGVVMVQVPPGCFLMGSWRGRRDEQPAHEVCFDSAFWIDRTEVTNAQFGSQGAFAGDDRPRENLTWFEARDHCAARGARLPTEAEWEYAARGPDSLYYPWGDEFDENLLVFDANFNNETAPVGSRPDGASWVGALDMSGNVWEWVSSLYRPYPYRADDGREAPDDPAGARVYRGGLGSYIDYGTSAATRFHAPADSRDWFRGFRCVRDAAQ